MGFPCHNTMQRPGTCDAAATDTGNQTKELLCLLRVWGPDIIHAEGGKIGPEVLGPWVRGYSLEPLPA